MFLKNEMTYEIILKRRGAFDERSTEYEEMEAHAAYKTTLRTWAKWVEENVDRNRTKVFFSSMAPLHVR